MPPALTTTSAAIVVARAVACSTSTPVTRPALDADPDHAVCGSGSSRPRCRAPAASAMREVRTGRASRRSAARRAPRTPSVAISGKRSRASSAVISSSGSPNVLAQPAWRWSSSNRAIDDASRSDPTSCHDGIDARSRRPSRRYSSAPYIIIFVSVTEPRSWPTSPALWNVEPEVSSARSTRTMSGPAALGEVVGDRRAADAAADDHRPGVLDHRRRSLAAPKSHRGGRSPRRAQWQGPLPSSANDPSVGQESQSTSRRRAA